MTIWQSKGPEKDVVLSVRLRIARNFNDIPFPTSMDIKDSLKVKDRILNLSKTFKEFNFRYYDFSSMMSAEILTFVERHVCSKELSKTPQMSGLLLSDDESASIMINEEDHIRAQVLVSGLDYERAEQKIKIIREVFDNTGNIAYDDIIGYLTSCPTNLGIGLRASAMIRIPSIAITSGLKNLAEFIKEKGFVLRGIYGEGTVSVGGIMQLSNAQSFKGEQNEVIEKVNELCLYIIDKERKARKILIDKNDIRLQDRIMRAYGILRFAKQITQKELGMLIGDVWLGRDLGLIQVLDDNDFWHLITMAQDANLATFLKEETNKTSLNKIRAEYIQKYIKEKEHI